MMVPVGNKLSKTNDGSKMSSKDSTGSTKLFTTSRRWWLHWLLKGNVGPWSDDQTSVAIGQKVNMTTNIDHKLDQKLMVKAQIVILTSPFHYGCMSIGIGELLSGEMTTTFDKGFFMNKMSFFHLYEMVMIFDFQSGGIFNKCSNEGWIIDLKKMISVSIIELTIGVKITNNLR